MNEFFSVVNKGFAIFAARNLNKPLIPQHFDLTLFIST